MHSDFTMAVKQEAALTNLDDQILDRGEATHNKVKGLSSNHFGLLASSSRDAPMQHPSFAEAATVSPASSQMRISGAIPRAEDFHLRSLSPLRLFVTWYQRACFRAELLADLRYRPEYLSDIGICRHEAKSETTRFFWEPVLLRRS